MTTMETMKTMDVSAGALAVLFSPTEEHVQNLLRLKALCAEVVAVDNSTHVNVALHDRLRALEIDVVVNSNQGGIAGAFNRGIDRLLELECTLLFTFDQDSVVSDNFFPAMIEASRAVETPYFLMGPKIFDINVDRYIPLLVMEPYGVTLTPMTAEDRGLVPCSSMISSGSVMSAATYQKVGPFREDYFIDQVDTEYCLRAARLGVPIYINTALTMKHEIGKRIDRKLGFFKFIQWNYVPLRQYYSARNCIHVARLYGRRLPTALLINLITLGQLISVLVYETNKLRKLGAMAAGVLDGLLGHYGPIEVCRPRVSAMCSQRPRLKQA